MTPRTTEKPLSFSYHKLPDATHFFHGWFARVMYLRPGFSVSFFRDAKWEPSCCREQPLQTFSHLRQGHMSHCVLAFQSKMFLYGRSSFIIVICRHGNRIHYPLRKESMCYKPSTDACFSVQEMTSSQFWKFCRALVILSMILKSRVLVEVSHTQLEL